MEHVYKRMQAEGKIGPYDENGRPRPYQEYPKLVRVDGVAHKVHSAREEIALAASASVAVDAAAPDDPVLLERNRLHKENEELRAQLELIAKQSAGAAVPGVKSPVVHSPKVPTAALLSPKESAA